MKELLVAITDDDNLIADLLRDYLSKSYNLKVLFTASNGKDLIAKLNSAAVLPDVLLLDLKMPEMNGIETTEYLKVNFPSIKIIIISSHYQRGFLNFIFKTGASAFVPKGISPVLLKDIISTVYHKGVYFMEDQVDIIREHVADTSPKPILDDEPQLSEREIEILKHICMQKTAKEIGELLFITSRTVEGHKNNLFVKTGAKNIAGLVVYAIQHKIINVESIPMI